MPRIRPRSIRPRSIRPRSIRPRSIRPRSRNVRRVIGRAALAALTVFVAVVLDPSGLLLLVLAAVALGAVADRAYLKRQRRRRQQQQRRRGNQARGAGRSQSRRPGNRTA
jgi:Flp pilus assembly protein TadB